MRRADVQRQSDRRLEILDATQRCFARAGFHAASMQKICAQAGMSPGNLYRYFPSKEALIAGICERNRAEAADNLPAVDRAPGFFEGLAGLARHEAARPRSPPARAGGGRPKPGPASSRCCAAPPSAARSRAKSISTRPPP